MPEFILKMKKKLLLFLVSLEIGLMLLPVAALAQNPEDYPKPGAQNPAMGIICRAGEVIGNMATAIAAIAWIFVGIMFLAAVGSPERFSTAKRALLWVVIGTIVLLVASVSITLINSAFGLEGKLGC